MLLPGLFYLSLDDQGGDGNVDWWSLPSPCSLLSLRSEETGAKQSNHDRRAGGALPDQVKPDGGWMTQSGWERVILQACLSISEQCQ